MAIVPIPTFKQPIFDGENTTRPWYFFFQSLYKNITAGITFTDGTHTVAGATTLTVTGGTIGGTTPNATLTVTGGGSGTVTSVGLADGSTTPIYAVSGSPVTAAGTLTETLVTQAANTVFAGPTTGSAAQPGFRALVTNDLPAFVSQNNVTPDSHGPIPTGVGLGPNDEFEAGSTIDTAGTRYSGATAWTALNILAATTAVGQGSLLFTSDSTSSSNPAWNLYMQPVAGATFTYVTKVSAAKLGSGAMSIFFRNSANGHILNCGLFQSPVTLFASRVVSPTSTSTSELSTGTVPDIATTTFASSVWVYLQIQYDGTNLKYSVSPSGVAGSFQQAYTETAAAFLAAAPTHVGIGVETLSIGTPTVVAFDWFRQTA